MPKFFLRRSSIKVFCGTGTSILMQNEEAIESVQNKTKTCCCVDIHIKVAAGIVSAVSSLLIVSNFIAKICGYSEIGWNFELLFLIVDSAAVASMIYGLHSEKYAFLQPFVVLSIITLSFLMLLAAYLATAILNSNSYAGQVLELELNKRLSDAAKKLNLEFKSMVSIMASLAFIGILLSIFIHFWFVYLTVLCAKYFRLKQQNR